LGPFLSLKILKNYIYCGETLGNKEETIPIDRRKKSGNGAKKEGKREKKRTLGRYLSSFWIWALPNPLARFSAHDFRRPGMG